METKIKIVSDGELVLLANEIIRETSDFFAVMVIGGDRVACCDEGVVFADDPHRGMVTIAPRGESGDGQPTIVGVFVRAADRKRGYGVALLEAAVRRCVERGFTQIRYDAMTKGGKKLVDKLPPELLAHLDVRDHSAHFPF